MLLCLSYVSETVTHLLRWCFHPMLLPLSSLLYSVQQVCFALEGFNNASAYHQDLMGLQALDLIAPVYRMMDSYVGVREKTLVLFASGLHQTKQHNLQEARYEVDSKLIPAVLTTFQ